jgi:very-short-patch-repair endonuclease
VSGDFRDGWTVGGLYPRQRSNRWDERHLARLGAAQDGVVRLDQLAALGLSADGRRTRIDQRRLIPLHRGVYAVGHDDLTERGRFRAFVWAAGEGALLGDLAAARLLGLWERPVRKPTVVVPLHRRPRLDGARRGRAEATHVRGIPCTSVAQTLVDLAPTPYVEPVFERAERKRWIRPAQIERLAYNRPGAKNVRALLASHKPASGTTRSLFERRLANELRDRGLPEPVVNGLLDLDGTIIEPDLMWPEHKVLLELDGGTHATPTAMRRDRARDRLALRHGWTPLRATWHDDPCEVAADIAAGINTPWPPSSPSSSPSPSRC